MDGEKKGDGLGAEGDAFEGVAVGGGGGLDEVVVFGEVLGDGLEGDGEGGGKLGDGGVGLFGGLEAADGGEEGVEGGAEVVPLEGGGEGDGVVDDVEAWLGPREARGGRLGELGDEGLKFSLGEGGRWCGGGLHGGGGLGGDDAGVFEEAADDGAGAVWGEFSGFEDFEGVGV